MAHQHQQNNPSKRLSDEMKDSMKLIIRQNTSDVRMVDDFNEWDGVTNNGQHPQLPGCILVEVNMLGNRMIIELLHPDTKPMTGHVDVYVDYKAGASATTFHYYSQYRRFAPQHNPIGTNQDMVWPTGGWSLIQTVLAIEAFLEKEIGFTPVLQESIFASLEKEALVPA